MYKLEIYRIEGIEALFQFKEAGFKELGDTYEMECPSTLFMNLLTSSDLRRFRGVI